MAYKAQRTHLWTQVQVEETYCLRSKRSWRHMTISFLDWSARMYLQAGSSGSVHTQCKAIVVLRGFFKVHHGTSC